MLVSSASWPYSVTNRMLPHGGDTGLWSRTPHPTNWAAFSAQRWSPCSPGRGLCVPTWVGAPVRGQGQRAVMAARSHPRTSRWLWCPPQLPPSYWPEVGTAVEFRQRDFWVGGQGSPEWHPRGRRPPASSLCPRGRLSEALGRRASDRRLGGAGLGQAPAVGGKGPLGRACERGAAPHQSGWRRGRGSDWGGRVPS